MQIPLDREAIQQIDLTPLSHLLDWNTNAKQFFLADAGQEHYKLLAYLSQHLCGSGQQQEVADVGTLHGASALALSINDLIKVYTFDIVKCIPEKSAPTPLSRPNIKMYVTSGQAVIPKLAECKLIVLDIDPHNGFQETDFVFRLLNHDFKGLLVVDDIHLNKDMKQFWNDIPSSLKKVDVTHLGHTSGTGIIVFDPLTIDVCL